MSGNRVLIVKLNKLGDTVAFLPTLDAIRKGMPDAYLTFMTTRVGRDLAEGTGLVDEIFVLPREEIMTFRGLYKWAGAVRAARFDTAAASSDSSSFVALLFFIASIPKRIGFENPKLSFLFNVRLPFSSDASHVGLNMLLAESLGCAPSLTRPEINFSEKDKAAARGMLERNGIKGEDKFAVMHLGSDKLILPQRWPIRRFAETADYIMTRYGLKIVVVGAAQETALASEMRRWLGGPSIVDLVGRTSVKELMCLISSARLFIGNPSGPLQMAYLEGTPSVSIWGATSFSNWGPVWDKERHISIRSELHCLGCEKSICPKKAADCMTFIAPDTVMKAVDKLL